MESSTLDRSAMARSLAMLRERLRALGALLGGGDGGSGAALGCFSCWHELAPSIAS